MAELSPFAKSVTIEKEISESDVSGLVKFIDMYCSAPKLNLIVDSSYRKIESKGETSFSWEQHSSDHQASLSVNLKIGRTVEASFGDIDQKNQSQLALYTRTLDQIRNLVWTYLQNAKKSTMYFVIGSAEGGNHSEAPSKSNASRNIMRRIFSGNTTNVFLLSLVLSFVLFLFIGDLTVILIIGLLLVYLVFADVITMNLGNVRPTIERPLAAVVSVRSKTDTLEFLGSHGKRILSEIREEVGHLVIRSGADAATQSDIKASVMAILSRNGIHTSQDDVEIKTRNVYSLVEKVAAKFGRPVPKIVIGNSVVSNAMATGISSKHSAIMITAGSLIDLTDDELESVVGHELGHVKGHDPVILFATSAVVYTGAFYLWYPLFLFLGLFYYVIAFGVLFAVGKVLETRADTESAVVLGSAQGLATSLTKIGFKQLYMEKYNRFGKLLDWFNFDPHPPIYFRISRLSALAGRESAIRHTFLDSLRDCIVGFFTAF